MRDMTKLSMEGLYKVRDLPTNIEEISITDIPTDVLENLRAYWNGIEGYPQKGQWYLKGREALEAHRATEDLQVKYPMAGLAITRPTNERLVVRILSR